MMTNFPKNGIRLAFPDKASTIPRIIQIKQKINIRVIRKNPAAGIAESTAVPRKVSIIKINP